MFPEMRKALREQIERWKQEFSITDPEFQRAADLQEEEEPSWIYKSRAEGELQA